MVAAPARHRAGQAGWPLGGDGWFTIAASFQVRPARWKTRATGCMDCPRVKTLVSAYATNVAAAPRWHGTVMETLASRSGGRPAGPGSLRVWSSWAR